MRGRACFNVSTRITTYVLRFIDVVVAATAAAAGDVAALQMLLILSDWYDPITASHSSCRSYSLTAGSVISWNTIPKPSN